MLESGLAVSKQISNEGGPDAKALLPCMSHYSSGYLG